MAIDAHSNFAYSTVATAPSPANSGTSLVVDAGDGALFPAVPFNATVWPAGAQPLVSNAEIVRVTDITTDTLTITREQEDTTARTITVGDQIAATISVKTFTDIESFIIPTVTTVTTDTSLVATSGKFLIECDTTNGDVTITLPSAVDNTAEFTIVKTDSSSNSVIVVGSINGDTSMTIEYQNSAMSILSTNLQWRIY